MNQFNYTDAELAIIEKAEKEFDMAKAAKTRKIDTMHSMWNQPYDLPKAIEIVTDFGKGDLLLGMEKIADIKSTDYCYDEDDFKRGTFLVSAYRVVHANFTKLGATLN